MTAPDYVAQAAELLGEHLPLADGSCLCGNGDRYLKPRAHRTHQAEVLAAAGLLPTSTEWGVRGVETSRVYDHHDGWTEQDAREGAAYDGWTLVSRAVADWKDAPDE